MQEEERECYLGDVVGAEVTEEERYGEILMKIEKTGQQWNREGIGIYGQALVANTILLGKITHRASVNTISTAMRKKLKEKFRAFIWKGEDRRAKVRWEVLVKKEEEGGIGLRDPLCAIDAAKMRIFVNLMTKDRQPWMKWIERKLRRVAKNWGVAEAMAARPTKKQLNGLKEDCVVESSLRIWFEIGGGGRGRTKEERTVKGETTTVELSGLGVTDTNEKWIPIEGLTGRQTYDRLIQTRMKIKDYEPRRAHKTIQKIQKQMTADERNYWWRLTHRTIQTKKRQSKWKKTEDGEFVKSTCPVCKEEEEDWEHYDYECKWMQEMNKKVAARVERDQPFSKEEWRLEEEKMSEKEMLMVAKARWIYHCERCKIDMKQRKRIDITVLMNRLTRRMKITTKKVK